MRTFMLGGPRARRRRSETLRDGALEFQSPHGLWLPARLAIEALPKKPRSPVLFGMDTEGAPALAARALWPDADITWFHLDAYVGRKVEGVLATNLIEDVRVDVDEDPPAGPFDLIVLPFPARAEGLLMRQLAEAAHDRLKQQGRLLAVTDGRPSALRATLKKVFGNFIPAGPATKVGAALYAERRKDATRSRDYSHVLKPGFRHADDDGETVLEIETRPGTFSHGHQDRGTRALIQWLQPRGAKRVLDLGAGCGPIGLYVAARLPEARVVMVESNARAAGCARRNAVRNGLDDRVTVFVRADVEDLPESAVGDGFDLVLANPPYFSNYRIAESFIRSAYDRMVPGGRLALVVKTGMEHADQVRAVFDNAGFHRAGEYFVVTARKID